MPQIEHATIEIILAVDDLHCDRATVRLNGPAQTGGTNINPTFKSSRRAVHLAVGFSGSVAAGPQEDAALPLLRGDYATGVRLFRPLADQGNAFTQSILGVMYATGRGVTQNYGAAVKEAVVVTPATRHRQGADL